MLRWLSRCLPALHILLFATLLIFAFTEVDEWTAYLSCMKFARGSFFKTEPNNAERSAPVILKLSQRIFICYAVFVHIDTIVFSTRLCVALVRVRRGILKICRQRNSTPTPGIELHCDGVPKSLTRSGPNRFDDAITTAPSTDFNANNEVVHAIILPNYAEDLETLSTTLRVLASHPRAVRQYEVYLAMERKEQGSENKAAALVAAFEHRFLLIKPTFHPAGLPGEVAGKGSNVSWAARQIFQAHRVDKHRGDVLITVIDSDTLLAEDYFSEIRNMHHTHPMSANALYVCPIIFDRNAHDVPIFVRVADILWGCAGLAGFLPGAPVLIPTSVYTIPLALAEDVGGWDGDATAIGEDMHMMVKAYFNSHGRLETLPVYSPASQSNVSSGAPRGLQRFIDNLLARWKQAVRHMWGSLDVGYAVRRMFKLRWLRLSHLPLFHLLWEAHMLPVHFVMILVASGLYTYFKPAELIHPDLQWAFQFMGVARFVGFVVMQVALTLYGSYHHACVTQRSLDMARAGIPESFAYRKSWSVKYLFDRIAFPVAGVLYGALPAIYAQFAHLFTDKLTYGVSVKPLVNVLV